MQTKYLLLCSSIAAAISSQTFAVDRVFIKEKKQGFVQPSEINKLVELNDNNTFKIVKEVKLNNGKVKHKISQYYKNIPVWGAGLSATQTKYGYENLRGSYFLNIGDEITSVSKRISKTDAFNIAFKAKNIKIVKNKKQTYIYCKAKIKKLILHMLFHFFMTQKNLQDLIL